MAPPPGTSFLSPSVRPTPNPFPAPDLLLKPPDLILPLIAKARWHRILQSTARLQALLDPTAEAMDASAASFIIRHRRKITFGDDGEEGLFLFRLFRALRNP